MKNLLLEDVKKIAVELGITLSYKNEEGKRKRYTKDELITKIEEISKLESKQVNAPLFNTLDSEIETKVEVTKSEFLIKEIVNGNPVITAKQFIKNNKINELKELIDNLYQLSNDKNEKPIQRSKFSKSLNLIKALLSSRKVAF